MREYGGFLYILSSRFLRNAHLNFGKGEENYKIDDLARKITVARAIYAKSDYASKLE